MTTNLTTEIRADASQFKTELAVADASVKLIQRSVDQLSRTMAKSGEATDAQNAALASQIAKLDAAKAELKELHEQQAKLEESNLGLIGSFKVMGESIAVAGEGLEHLTKQATAVSNLGVAFGEVFAVGLAGDKLFESAEKFAEFGDGLKKLSEETGVSVENLNALRYAAAQSDLGFDQLGKALTKFAIAVANDTGPAREALQNLGISQDELAEHGNESAYMLDRVAKAMAAFGTGTEKEAYVAALFGARLRDMQPVLETLANQGFAGLIAKEQELGGDFGEAFADRAKTAHDGLVDLTEATNNLKIAFGEAFAPTLIEHMNAVVGLLREATGYTTGMEEGAEVTGKILETSARLKEVQAKIANGDTWDFNNSGLGKTADEAKQLEDKLKELRTRLKEINTPESETEKPKLPPLKGTDENTSAAIKADQAELTEKLRAGDGGKGLFGPEALAQEHEFWTEKLALATGEGKQEVALREEIAGKLRQIEVEQHSASIHEGAKSAEEQKRALDEWFANYSTGIKTQIGEAENNAERQKQLVESWIATGEQLYAEDTKKYEAALSEKLTLAKKAADELAADQKTAATKGLAGIDRDEATSLGIAKKDDHVIGDPAQAERDAIAIVAAALNAKLKILDTWHEQAGENKKIQKEIADAQVEAEQKAVEQVVQIQAEAAEKTRQEWDSVNKDIASGLSSGIMDALEGKKGGIGAALQKWADQKIGSGLETVLDKGLGSLEGTLGIKEAGPGALLGKGLDSLGLDGVSKFLGLGADTAKDAPLIASQTANTAALNALTVAMGGTVPALATNTVATTANSGASITAAGAAGAGAAASAANTAVTGVNTATQSSGIIAWVANTASTIANTIATDAAAIGKFFGFAGGGSPPVGVPSIVGERGPELFLPQERGTIFPNGRFPSNLTLAGGGGELRVPAGIDLSGRISSPSAVSPRIADYLAARDAREGGSSPGGNNHAIFHQHNHFSGGEATSGEEMLADLVGKHGRSGVQSLAAKLMR